MNSGHSGYHIPMSKFHEVFIVTELKSWIKVLLKYIDRNARYTSVMVCIRNVPHRPWPSTGGAVWES